MRTYYPICLPGGSGIPTLRDAPQLRTLTSPDSGLSSLWWLKIHI